MIERNLKKDLKIMIKESINLDSDFLRQYLSTRLETRTKESNMDANVKGMKPWNTWREIETL